MYLTILQITTTFLRLISYLYVITFSNLSTTLLLTIGYLPIFAILDTLIMSHSRWEITKKSFIANKKFKEIITSVAVFICASIFFLKENITLLLILILITIYIINSFTWRFEFLLSENKSVILLTHLEITFILISFILITHSDFHWSGLLVFLSLPLSRIITTLIKLNTAQENPKISNSGIKKKSTYIAYYVIPQFLASMAASMPAIIFNLYPDQQKLANALIISKYIHSFSAFFSLFINILSSRIFFKKMGKNWSLLEKKLEISIKSYYFPSLFIVPISLIGYFIFEQTIETQFFFLSILIPFMAITNLNSSLGSANNKPNITLLSQVLILLSSLYISLYIYRESELMVVIFLLFITVSLISLKRFTKS